MAETKRNRTRPVDEAALKALIGRNLRAIRESLGYEQTEMADRLGVRHAAYRNWERGTSYPQGDGVWQLANMGINLNRLYLGTGPITREAPKDKPQNGKNRKATRGDIQKSAQN